MNQQTLTFNPLVLRGQGAIKAKNPQSQVKSVLTDIHWLNL